MSSDGFGKLNKGDCVSFFADVYRYIKKSDGKKLDYGLRNPEGVEKINKYDLPSDDDLFMQEIDSMLCETCAQNVDATILRLRKAIYLNAKVAALDGGSKKIYKKRTFKRIN